MWIDTLIKPGEMWRESIARALEEVDVVLFLMTSESLSSRYCEEEVMYAFELGKDLQPLVAGNDVFAVLKQKPVLRAILSPIQFIQFVNVPLAESLAVIDVRMKNARERSNRESMRFMRKTSSRGRRASFSFGFGRGGREQRSSSGDHAAAAAAASEVSTRRSSYTRQTMHKKSIAETGRLWFGGFTEDTLQATRIEEQGKKSL